MYGHQLSEVDVIMASHINDKISSNHTPPYVQRWFNHVKCCEDKPLSITKDIKKDVLTSFGDFQII